MYDNIFNFSAVSVRVVWVEFMPKLKKIIYMHIWIRVLNIWPVWVLQNHN